MCPAINEMRDCDWVTEVGTFDVMIMHHHFMFDKNNACYWPVRAERIYN